jgi:DMSO/TMAO reductase YedYZ molybdopterin-dependent catalytic subunit
MKQSDTNSVAMSRRDFLAKSGVVLAGLALLNSPARIFAQEGDAIVLPWLDQRIDDPPPERVANQQTWEKLDSWITPNDQFFSIAHYNRPEIDSTGWQLQVGGLVSQPLTFTLDELKTLPRQEVIFTLECSGNNGRPVVDSIIGNAQWAGTPLAGVLETAGVLQAGREVVFFGADAGEEAVREQTIIENFARSMSLDDALNPANLLVYEMNGEPLPQPNGYPLRLIAPGWFGIANIKWLERIEVWDTRLMNRWMARDYVTVRNEGTAENPDWTESSVSRILLKSAPGRVVQHETGYRIDGAAWGAPIQAVEVKIDDGEWQTAVLDTTQQADYAWTFWTLDWANPTSGEHSITSRAIDSDGNIQPAADDPALVNKITYWESNGQITRRVNIA